MANQVCFCASKPPEGGLGAHLFSSTLVRSFKQVKSNGKIIPELAKPAERAGLERNFYVRQQVVNALDQLADGMPVRSLPQILRGEMDIYLRARDHPVPQ